MIKFLISDYDDTFYTDDESIKINLNKINEFRNKGNLFAIATGRSYISFKDKIDKYNIKFDYLILAHGAIIYDKNLNLIKNDAMNEDLVRDILNYINKINKYSIYLFNSIYLNEMDNYSNVTKISIQFNTKEEAREIEKLLKKEFSEFVKIYQINHVSHYIEMISRNTSKSNAIKYLINKINISKENVYVIGNGINDLEMIKDFDGYAMVNSEEEILKNTSKLYKNVYELIDTI